MYLLGFYVPESHLESVKEALFQAGAGNIGNYSKCCWQIKGEGQFLPNENSSPFSGEIGQISHEVEYKVELVCDKTSIKQVIKALKTHHPYEEPAFHVLPYADLQI